MKKILAKTFRVCYNGFTNKFKEAGEMGTNNKANRGTSKIKVGLGFIRDTDGIIRKRRFVYYRADIKNPTDMANYVLKEYSLKSLPINLDYICEKENIKTIEYSFIDLEKKLEKKIAGATLLNQENKTILVNFSDTAQRKKFAIAHELGHYFMHSRFFNVNIPMINNRLNNTQSLYSSEKKIISFISFRIDKNIIEKEANRFAAELLMPKNMLFEEYKKRVFPTYGHLANIFGVSDAVMKMRMDELGIKYFD